jgi:hypothetical protein
MAFWKQDLFALAIYVALAVAAAGAWSFFSDRADALTGTVSHSHR